MADLPKTTRRIMVVTPCSDFRKATELCDVPMPEVVAKSILVKMKYVGINATDINITAARYAVENKPPFPCGLEGLGEVVAVGADSKFKVGQFAAFLMVGSFSEYVLVPDDRAAPVPLCDPALVSVLLSGPTASISIEKNADLKEGETVLVTGAAGGTGMFAVQLAKQAGCHVIGTCSSPAKVEFLKSIGCDRPINYKEENLDEVLKKEYPKGLNVVYECIGGDVFDAALGNLAKFGRIIAIGQISKYQGSTMDGPLTEPECKFPITMRLVSKSASIRGFLLTDYVQDQIKHVTQLAQMYSQGKLKLTVDRGEGRPEGAFKGLEQVPDAIDYMFSGKNTGKLVVEI